MFLILYPVEISHFWKKNQMENNLVQTVIVNPEMMIDKMAQQFQFSRVFSETFKRMICHNFDEKETILRGTKLMGPKQCLQS